MSQRTTVTRQPPRRLNLPTPSLPCRVSRVETGPRSMAIRSSFLAYLSNILFDLYKHLAQWSSPMLLRRYLVRAGRSSTARSHQLRQQTKLRPSTCTSSHSAYCHRVYTRRQTNAHEGKMHCIVAILRKRSSFVFPSMKCSVSPRTEQHRSAIWVYCMS